MHNNLHKSLVVNKSAMLDVWPFWTHNTEDRRTMTRFRNQKWKATQNMIEKEFHALVNTQMTRFLKYKNKDLCPKNIKRKRDTFATFIESSHLGDERN